MSIARNLANMAINAANYLRTNAAATLTKGFPNTPYNMGTFTSGTVTPDISNGHDQYGTLNGATVLALPTGKGDVTIEFTNGASAAALDVTAYGGNVDGADYDTTSGNKFLFYIKNGQAMAHLTIFADSGNA